jgi:hypothetical protein
MIKKTSIALLKLVGIFVGLAVACAVSTEFGMALAVLVLGYSVVAAFRALPGLGRGLAWPMGLIAAIALTAGAAQVDNEREARLAELRGTNVDAYLAELADLDDGRWLAELEALRPDAHQAEVKRRQEAAEEQRQQRYAAACGDRNATMAFVMQQDAVRSQLKAPATARFPSVVEAVVRTEADCTFRVRSYVDAQNSFGALIRSNYETVIRHFPDDGTWQVQSVLFAD